MVRVLMSFGIGFDNPYTLEEIGDVMGLTRERVRQIMLIDLQAFLMQEKSQGFTMRYPLFWILNLI